MGAATQEALVNLAAKIGGCSIDLPALPYVARARVTAHSGSARLGQPPNEALI